MHHSRKNDLFEIAPDFRELFASFRSALGQRANDRARLGVRGNWSLRNGFAIVGDPIGDLVKLTPESLRACLTN